MGEALGGLGVGFCAIQLLWVFGHTRLHLRSLLRPRCRLFGVGQYDQLTADPNFLRSRRYAEVVSMSSCRQIPS